MEDAPAPLRLTADQVVERVRDLRVRLVADLAKIDQQARREDDQIVAACTGRIRRLAAVRDTAVATAGAVRDAARKAAEMEYVRACREAQGAKPQAMFATVEVYEAARVRAHAEMTAAAGPIGEEMKAARAQASEEAERKRTARAADLEEEIRNLRADAGLSPPDSSLAAPPTAPEVSEPTPAAP